jgi:phosphoglycolate phosphatase
MMTRHRVSAERHQEYCPAAVVFDLDGTLVDSLGDITSSLNDLVVSRGLAPFTLSAVREFVGEGIEVLVERALRARSVVCSSGEFRKMVSCYELIYGSRLTETTRAYEGVIDVLSELRTRGAGIGVCTNKLEEKAIRVIHGLGLREFVDVIVGARGGRPPKPSPVPLLATLEHLGAKARDSVMVGDSAADVQCARAAGTAVIGVSFGYSRTPMRDLGADVTIDDYAEFMPACVSLGPRVR